ncbi:hypothetical protein [Algoriphagus taiwanensis]|uniref:hypothetical protein n=1 Tax=Algoriphagus taiwanensis TaxID=1445656 RepID=UPI0030C66A03
MPSWRQIKEEVVVIPEEIWGGGILGREMGIILLKEIKSLEIPVKVFYALTDEVIFPS